MVAYKPLTTFQNSYKVDSVRFAHFGAWFLEGRAFGATYFAIFAATTTTGGLLRNMFDRRGKEYLRDIECRWLPGESISLEQSSREMELIFSCFKEFFWSLDLGVM